MADFIAALKEARPKQERRPLKVLNSARMSTAMKKM